MIASIRPNSREKGTHHPPYGAKYAPQNEENQHDIHRHCHFFMPTNREHSIWLDDVFRLSCGDVTRLEGCPSPEWKRKHMQYRKHKIPTIIFRVKDFKILSWAVGIALEIRSMSMRMRGRNIFHSMLFSCTVLHHPKIRTLAFERIFWQGLPWGDFYHHYSGGWNSAVSRSHASRPEP